MILTSCQTHSAQLSTDVASGQQVRSDPSLFWGLEWGLGGLEGVRPRLPRRRHAVRSSVSLGSSLGPRTGSGALHDCARHAVAVEGPFGAMRRAFGRSRGAGIASRRRLRDPPPWAAG